jgi:thiamine transport system permease protein
MTPNNATLETVMADVGGAAGIANYQIYANELVLASSTIQFVVLIVALWMLAVLQAKRSRTIAEVSESYSRKQGRGGWVVLIPALIFCLSPLIAVIRASLRVAERGTVISHRWTLDGWQSAISGDYAYLSIIDGLLNSLGYAALTLVIALPLGWSLSSGIHLLEKRGSHWAKPLDILTMLPLAISGVMLGLGILLGIIRISPVFFTMWWMPAVPHIMLATPFVVRLLLPAMRRQDPALIENAQVLALSRWHILTKIRIPLLRGPLIVAGIIAIAMSMGEFGASWILVRTGAWDTLPVLVDQLMARPGFDPLVKPTAMAAASLLMFTTLVLFLLAERFRADGDGGMF